MKLLRELIDHGRRTIVAIRGFKYHGLSWLAPWLAYSVSPILSRVFKSRELHFHSFSVRLGECDLYTFANLYEDYRMEDLQRALGAVELVIDAGANVGAFSWLVVSSASAHPGHPHVIAVEPDGKNCAYFRRQPFASKVELIEGAIGPHDGRGLLNQGANSVTHTVAVLPDEAPPARLDQVVSVSSLGTLCAGRPTLLKMDIEGGEWDILASGLPDCIDYMFLEAHVSETQTDDPRRFVTHGTWRLLSRDIYGSSCWFWSAKS